MQIWGVPLWISLREIRYLKEEQLANIHQLRHAVQAKPGNTMPRLQRQSAGSQ